MALLLAGCAGPRSGGAGRDGPDPRPPGGLAQVPDATPRIEPIRSGGPNKPYSVLGRSYTPLQGDATYTASGLASWYGRKFQGLPTSSGEPYDMYAMTAAHPTLPIPSYARVRNPANGREVIVRINDRGPFHEGRVIDLSYTAALKLDLLRGVAPVEVRRITADEIRAGSWRADQDSSAIAMAPMSLPAPPAAGSQRSVAVVAVPLAAVQPVSTTNEAPPADSYLNANTAMPRPASPSPTAQPASLAEAGSATAPADSAASPRIVATPLPPLPSLQPLPAATAPLPTSFNALSPAASAPGAGTTPSAGSLFWMQLGAFAQAAGAEQLRQKAVAAASSDVPQVEIFAAGGLHRVQAGPFDSREAARLAAVRLGADLGLTPVIVVRP